MFRNSSNFIENNREMNTDIPIINIQVENPSQFGKYLALFYGQKLILTGKNFLDFYKMADYFTDNKMIEKISNFIKNLNVNDKLANDNIVELSRYTENFDETIIYYIEMNFLDVKQVYNLSKNTNRFKENLDNYFKNTIFDGFGKKEAEQGGTFGLVFKPSQFKNMYREEELLYNIAAMEVIDHKKCLAELRFEDYKNGKREGSKFLGYDRRLYRVDNSSSKGFKFKMPNSTPGYPSHNDTKLLRFNFGPAGSKPADLGHKNDLYTTGNGFRFAQSVSTSGFSFGPAGSKPGDLEHKHDLYKTGNGFRFVQSVSKPGFNFGQLGSK